MPKPQGFNFRILIVDDEPAILETSSAVLGTKGYEVRPAADGFQALAELTRSLPDLLISDLRTGYAALVVRNPTLAPNVSCTVGWRKVNKKPKIRPFA